MHILTVRIVRVQAKEGESWSDAALSCPGCFTLVCLDCQQHAKYKTQYRAMFVVNCMLNDTQRLKAEGTTFVPVQCGECGECASWKVCSLCLNGCGSAGTELGVKDTKEEVYEFFNVLPSAV